MRAITTRYSGPTNTRGAKIIASSERDRVSVPYGHGDARQEHLAAAKALCHKLKWGSYCDRMIGGGTKDGFAFVFAPERCKCPDGALGRAKASRSRRRKRSR